ncbi:MAG: biosynthetic-type acetolactate synthase large subunit [Anaerolineae bacterium]|nr:biosynthetic-type acetolactate synthase large subunit [Anaerolineae bacterium]MCB0205106.1 biosynthetic-type acetolactate synthase large subunit [Anaerolineae bacterium]MCB0255098.1 biosynthetic-type acetolactate synthase large subunit [Anaerolineae bacterium]
MQRTGAQIVWETIVKEGIDIVFGYPGGAILPTYDAMPAYPVRHILVRHEQAAAHMAEGWARVTGKVGVCIATSGPGATNLVTGLANAMMDSIPIVAITGQVATNLLGNDAFQETDVTGVTLPITKYNYLVTDINDLGEAMAEAFYIARTGRPGPVLVDICKDVQNASIDWEYPETLHRPGLHKAPRPEPNTVDAAAELINTAKRPVIIAGHGVAMGHAESELLELAERANIPVVSTLLGLGSMPETHPLAMGMGGMHGEAATNHAIQECDVLIAIGMRFDDRVTGRLDKFAPNAKIIHYEMDPSEVGKNVKPTVAVLGDCRVTLAATLQHVQPNHHEEWLATVRGWQTTTREVDIANQEVDELIPPFVMRQLWHSTKGNCTVVTDVGQHQMWEAQYFTHTKSGQLITSGGLGTMGFGLPAAMGAALGNPGHVVWAIVGDGGFQQTLQELGTIVQDKIPVKIGIVNNGFLGMVRQWQQFFYEKRYAGTPMLSPDYMKLADAYGIPSLRVTSNDGVADAFRTANEHDGPFLVEFRVKEEVNVYPMVAPGAHIGEMIRRPGPAVVQGYSGVQPSW